MVEKREDTGGVKPSVARTEKADGRRLGRILRNAVE